MGRLFGTDGARGIAVTELTCELAEKIGRAAAYVLANGGSGAKVLIGKDTRVSSDIIECALAAGIASVGADVALVGVVPTPAVAFLTKCLNASAGVMISASHNPAEYNGIKLFSADGRKLPDETEDEIERLVFSTDAVPLKRGGDVGRISRRENARALYSDSIRDLLGNAADKARFCFDCANGSAASTAREIFGGQHEYIFANPDGVNINGGCGSTHIERLRDAVTNGGFDAGFAFDGDADRCIAVDKSGDIIDGDKIIAIIARYLKQTGRLNGGAVVTVMSSLGLKEALNDSCIDIITTKVGDRYVLEEMLRSGYNIGGEQSGHIILSDYSTTGDGQLTAAMLIRVMAKTGKSLSELSGDIKDYPRISINIGITESFKQKWGKISSVKTAITEAELSLEGSGRILVRESGTEPLLRVMVEGRDERLTQSAAERIVLAINAAMSAGK